MDFGVVLPGNWGTSIYCGFGFMLLVCALSDPSLSLILMLTCHMLLFPHVNVSVGKSHFLTHKLLIGYVQGLTLMSQKIYKLELMLMVFLICELFVKRLVG